MEECLLYQEPALYECLFPAAPNTAAVDEVRRQRLLNSQRFYLEQARESGGRVLDLACGNGRLTLPIAQSGIQVMGVDSSASMLDVARSRASTAGLQVEFTHGDMRSFQLPAKFSAILIAGNSLLHLLTAEDVKRCFNRVCRHLAPGGRLVFDIMNPDMSVLAPDSQKRHLLFRVNDAERGEVTLEEIARYDATTQIRYIKWFLSTADHPDFRVIDYSLHLIFSLELPLLLESAGLRLESRYGEFTREPFQSSSPRQLCICKAKS